MKPDKIYIIHYTKLKDRYENIHPFLKNCKIPYEFITDYDQETLSDDIIKKYYFPDETLFNNKTNNLWDSTIHKFRVLNKPEISCTIKHLVAIKKISEECSNFGLILEDDVIFYENFNFNYNECFKQTPEDWDAIFLGEGCGVNFQNDKILSSKKITSNCYLVPNPATNCAEAYLLKPSVAKSIYESATPFQLVSDWEIAYQLYKLNSKTYWWYPSLVTQGSRNGKYQSTLDLGQRS
jgi:GR25 family glycosyltransferase involved in LPS biosynthesis